MRRAFQRKKCKPDGMMKALRAGMSAWLALVFIPGCTEVNTDRSDLSVRRPR